MDKELLYVEDNQDDVKLLKTALRSIGFKPKLSVVEDGIEALEFITSRASGKQAFPSVILLDLNLPRMNGYEVLEHLKTNVEFKHLPIIAFTGSTNLEDQIRCQSLGADHFWLKPKDLTECFKTAEKLKSFMRDDGI